MLLYCALHFMNLNWKLLYAAKHYFKQQAMPPDSRGSITIRSKRSKGVRKTKLQNLACYLAVFFHSWTLVRKRFQKSVQCWTRNWWDIWISLTGSRLIAINKVVLCECLKWFNFDTKLIEKKKSFIWNQLAFVWHVALVYFSIKPSYRYSSPFFFICRSKFKSFL